MCHLIDLLLTIPATSLECEWGFSHMRHIKSDWRSRLTNSTLTDLMRILMESDSIENYNPEPAVDLWWEKTKGEQGDL